jgi:hypothetical protein
MSDLRQALQQNVIELKILIQSKSPHKNEFFNVFNFNSME